MGSSASSAPPSIQRATQGGVTEVRAAIREDLGGLGLTLHEAEAFMRAWDSALFGAQGSVDGRSATVDGIPADMPVRSIDSLTTDESAVDRPMIPGAPHITDTILYWLPADDIESMAALSFSPEPQEVSRAILVRVDASWPWHAKVDQESIELCADRLAISSEHI